MLHYGCWKYAHLDRFSRELAITSAVHISIRIDMRVT